MLSCKFKKIVATMLVSSCIFLNISTISSAVEKPEGKKVTSEASSQNKDLKRKIVGYFPEWAYKSEAQAYFDVADLQWDSLTHIQYSFAMIDPQTNKIKFGDEHAAIKEDFSNHELTHKGKKVELDPTLPYKGHFNILQTMKKQYPDVDLLISVGGWAGSRGFYTMLDTDAGINTFADSCVDFIRTYGFDGVDIDFEYPSSTSQSGNPDDFDLSEPRRAKLNERYNLLMKTLREKLDAASKTDGKDYLLTAAVTASSWVLGGVSSNEYAKNLDFLSVMSYDFHGGWNEFVENLANIYPDPADKETSAMLMPVLNMDWAYRYYRGVLPSEKILMGIPYYTRGWENVQGGTNGLHGTSKTPASGKYNIWGDDLNGDGVLEPAGANPLWHGLNLMDQDPNVKEYWDDVGKVPHLWNDKDKTFLSFENEKSIDERVKYIEDKNLGGALIWVMNGDYGLNPNYVEGSTKINEGKYTFGDTLTKRLKAGLDKMGDCKETNDEIPNLEPINVDVKLGGVYDHPNYTYTLDITNHTGEKIEGGWTVSFDLPKSAVYNSSWGGTATTEDINDTFTRVTITGGAWQGIDPGAKISVQGMIGLCFSGVRNITFNGKNPVGNSDITVNSAPTIKGATNTEIKLNEKFDPKAGVTASDKEDGDLTSKISIEGTVDTTKVGSYKLIYTVKDSKNLETKVERTIKVVNNSEVTPDSNTAPVLTGVTNKTIKLNEKFDPKAGVTASDKEDGDLTSKIIIEGTVDTTKAGTYTLVYKVKDSKGLETNATAIITVIKESTPSNDTYDANKVYLAGDTVIYNGKTYTAKWWTKGEAPDKSSAWELVVTPNADGTVNYTSGKAYNGGAIVKYNGKNYKAAWWTNSLPGSDSSWILI
ncbi:glycosyl hydrolase family 18 protein [Clostridium sp.]|uniref:glycosyl hydrolase family 18 protein n=1 Tax=Clostridium sp. TaxID=1506 RepID=UPI003991D308